LSRARAALPDGADARKRDAALSGADRLGRADTGADRHADHHAAPWRDPHGDSYADAERDAHADADGDAYADAHAHTHDARQPDAHVDGPAGFLGCEQHPARAERDDVQVPEPYERTVRRRPRLLERQDQRRHADALDRGATALRHAGQLRRADVLLPRERRDDADELLHFIEYTISATRFNGNTTRVDAFGIKVAIRLHNDDGSEQTVGENPATFAESRSATFQRFLDAVPAEFDPLAQLQAPYRILNPGWAGFSAGGAQQDYYKAYIDEVWATNNLTIPKAGPNASGLGSYPNLSAAIYRHTAAPGTFAPDGKLLDTHMWDNPATFYLQPPADYYAKFWHDNGINGKAYGFPYDDVGGYSTFIAHDNPQYVLVAIGW